MYQLSIDDYLEETREIPLTQGRIALVSACDFDWLNQWKWSYFPCGYAARRQRINGKSICIYMHRFITTAPVSLEVDHINGIKLDDRRCNLRLASGLENHRNIRKRKAMASKSSQYKGVWWHTQRKRWTAAICPNRKKMYLGLFDDEIEAARAYDRVAREVYGEFAPLNFPQE